MEKLNNLISMYGGKEMDYGLEIYKNFLRPVLRKVVEKYPDNSKDMIEEEMEYLRSQLRESNVEWMFRNIMNANTFYKLLLQSMSEDEIDKQSEENKAERKEQFEESKKIENKYQEKDIEKVHYDINLSDEESPEKGIVWILQSSGIRFAGKKSLRIQERRSFNLFEKMLNGMGFSDETKSIFRYASAPDSYYFNALTGSINKIYEQIPFHYNLRDKNGRNKELYDIAIKHSNWQTMHEKLKGIFEIYYEDKDKMNVRKLSFKDSNTILDNFYDLIPVVDNEQRLKTESRLNEECKKIQVAVYDYYYFQLADGKIGDEDYTNQAKSLINLYQKTEEIFELICNKNDFNNKQIIALTYGYLECTKYYIDIFEEKIKEYRTVCALSGENIGLIQNCINIWHEIWNDSLKN